MSSGEVLFILAFIVLPTAVLVSSAWAVLFVRRQPDRVVESDEGETIHEGTGTNDQLDVVVDTVVLPTVARSDAARPVGAEVEDNGEPEESAWQPEPDQDTLLVGPDVPDDIPLDRFDDERAPHEEPQQEPVSNPEYDEPEMLQKTEDLNDVVAEVKAHDAQEQEPPAHEAVDDTEIYETTDLPVMERPEKRLTADVPESQPVEPQRQFESDAGDEVDEREAEAPSGSRWRRRKRPAPLRPNDPDAGRARGRSREPQRQVPQLGRTPRRRDGSLREMPSDSEADEDQGDRT